MIFSDQDYFWMQQAIELAKQASLNNEVPVGAVIVQHNELIATGFNQPISHNDPTAHAEIIALRAAAKKLNNYRLIDCTLYVTLEPCMMCVGALIHARIKRVFFAAADPKLGASALFNHEQLNHKIDYAGGILATECGKLLTDFFQARRA